VSAARSPTPLVPETRPFVVTTPEGIDLHFGLASVGERAGAYLLDLLFTWGGTFVLVLLVSLATGGGIGNSWLGVILFLGIFLLQTGYFIWFETRRHGMTPGKRRVGIRVMDAGGGTLTAESVVVRLLEFQLPLVAIAAPEALWPGAPAWARLPALLWLGILGLLPLFNRQRLRVGDLVAGTVVVLRPEGRLLDDLGRTGGVPEADVPEAYAFTPQQLEVYGAYELHVLEDVLRGQAAGGDAVRAQRAVADRIARKIRWRGHLATTETHAFLLAYYKALRAHLEQGLLFGKRKRDKYSKD
jgi:uncharacterized RDD family membrane protein YckC